MNFDLYVNVNNINYPAVARARLWDIWMFWTAITGVFPTRAANEQNVYAELGRTGQDWRDR